MRSSRAIPSLLAIVLVLAGCVAWAAPPIRYQYFTGNSQPSDLYGQAEIGYAGASIISSRGDVIRAQADMVKAQAEMIKAQAAAAESYAKVQETMQKTRALALDNDVKTAKTFFDKRKLNEEYKTLHQPTRVDSEQLARYSRAMAPKPLETYQIERARGILYWPAVFNREQFVEHREAIDQLFKYRKPNDIGPDSDFYQQVHESVETLRAELKGVIGDLSPSQYVAARRFLDGLAKEADNPPEIAGIAKR